MHCGRVWSGSGSLKIDFVGELNDKMKGFYRSKYTTAAGEVRYAAVTQFEVSRCLDVWIKWSLLLNLLYVPPPLPMLQHSLLRWPCDWLWSTSSSEDEATSISPYLFIYLFKASSCVFLSRTAAPSVHWFTRDRRSVVNQRSKWLGPANVWLGPRGFLCCMNCCSDKLCAQQLGLQR